MKELIKEIKEAPNSEKFWTSILALMWIALAIYSMPYFLLGQTLYFFIIIIMAVHYEEGKEWAWLWLGTSVIVLLIVLTTLIIESIKVTNPIKRFNNWLNNK